MGGACADAGVTLMVGHAFRRLGAARRVKELLDEGALGRWSSPRRCRCPARSSRAHGSGARRNPGRAYHAARDPPRGHAGLLARPGAGLRAPTPVDDVGVTSELPRWPRSRHVSPKTLRCACSGRRRCSTTATSPSGGRAGARRRDHAQLGGEPVAFDERDMLAEELAEFGRCIRGEAEPETGADEGIAALGAVLSRARVERRGCRLMRAAVIEEGLGSPPEPGSAMRPGAGGTALVAVEAAPLNPVGGAGGRRPPPEACRAAVRPGSRGRGHGRGVPRLRARTPVRFEAAAFGLRGRGRSRSSRRPGAVARRVPERVAADLAAARRVASRPARARARRAAAASGCWLSERPAPSARWRSSSRVMGAARVVGRRASADASSACASWARTRSWAGQRRPRTGLEDAAGGQVDRDRSVWGEPAMASLRARHRGPPRDVGQSAGPTWASRLSWCATARAHPRDLIGLDRARAQGGRLPRSPRARVAGRLAVDRELVPLEGWPRRGTEQDASRQAMGKRRRGGGSRRDRAASSAAPSPAGGRAHPARRTRYLDDIDPDGAAHVAFVRSLPSGCAVGPG